MKQRAKNKTISCYSNKSKIHIIQVIESGSKNIEIAVMTRGAELRFLEESEIDKYVKQIEAEKEQAKKEQARATNTNND